MSYLGEDIRKLGFGLMRLPQTDGVIDIEQTKEMVDLFMDAGFTYFDTACAYAGSEDAIRQALVERYPRESYQLATKNAAWINCKTKEEAYAQFDVSLKQTGAGYFDFYLLHNLGEARTEYFDKFDMWNWVAEKKVAGLIKHVGFSFHSTPEELNKISLIPCTSCNYCAKVCPMQIGISGSFTAMNSLTLYSDKDMALHQENWLVGSHGLKRANECVKCGKCEEACPQHIQIRAELEHVSEELLK